MNISFTPGIRINEVMVVELEHAAHFIGETANPDARADGIHWQEAEQHAIQLIASRSARCRL